MSCNIGLVQWWVVALTSSFGSLDIMCTARIVFCSYSTVFKGARIQFIRRIFFQDLRLSFPAHAIHVFRFYLRHSQSDTLQGSDSARRWKFCGEQQIEQCGFSRFSSVLSHGAFRPESTISGLDSGRRTHGDNQSNRQ
ncbi:hypothetical protein DFH06DRAFT_516981 [Mycena polygramma]|nr:hypothetical protein DFH06DRAFT_516981 [Mycena polygramma]